jgi:hypothetical protein
MGSSDLFVLTLHGEDPFALKLCPFCGSEKVGIVELGDGFIAGCKKCGAHTRRMEFPEITKLTMENLTKRLKRRAQSAWNRRV